MCVYIYIYVDRYSYIYTYIYIYIYNIIIYIIYHEATDDVIGFYSSIPLNYGLKALYGNLERIEDKEVKKTPLTRLVNTVQFVIKTIIAS